MLVTKSYSLLPRRIVIPILCFAIVPLLLVSILIPLQFSDFRHAQTIREVKNLALSNGRIIDIFLEERLAQLQSLAGMYSYDELKAPGKLTEVLRVLQSNSQPYVDLGIIDLNGSHIAYAGSYEVKNANYKNEPWFLKVQRQKVVISDAFLGFRRFPHIIIAVMREEGDTSWILRATIDSEVLTSTVQSGRLNADGDAFVINRDNILQTNSRFAGSTMTEIKVTWPQKTDTLVKIILHGKDMLLTKVPLTRAPWFLVVAKTPQEHFFLFTKMELLSEGILVFLLLTLCFTTWFTARYILKKIGQVDTENAAFTAGLVQSSKMATIGKRAAGVAHEINNPLMLISQTAGWIKDLMEDENPKTMRHYDSIVKSAEKIEKHVGRAKTITQNLLGFARKVSHTSKSVSLTPIIDRVVDFLHTEAVYRNISIVKNYTKEPIRVTTDIGQIQQVLLNIIDNAIDAAPKGGQVTITTTLEAKMARITVHDNGVGIPQDLLNSIFEPFFTTKTAGEGTGLGLSICCSIMENLKGSIEAYNLPDGGAGFAIILPVAAIHEKN